MLHLALHARRKETGRTTREGIEVRCDECAGLIRDLYRPTLQTLHNDEEQVTLRRQFGVRRRVDLFHPLLLLLGQRSGQFDRSTGVGHSALQKSDRQVREDRVLPDVLVRVRQRQFKGIEEWIDRQSFAQLGIGFHAQEIVGIITDGRA